MVVHRTILVPDWPPVKAIGHCNWPQHYSLNYAMCIYYIHVSSTTVLAVCVCVRKTEGCQQIVFHDPLQLRLKRLDKEGFVVGENVMGNNVLWKLWNRERDQASMRCIHLFRSMGVD